MTNTTEYLAIAIRQGRKSCAARVAGAICLRELSADPRLTEHEREVLNAIWLDYGQLTADDARRKWSQAAEALVRTELAKERKAG